MLKWSNFHVTVNFNKSDTGHMDTMKQAVEEMVDEPYLWWWLKHYDGNGQVNFNDETKTAVETVRMRAAFENEGKQNHGLHLHILIEIGHTTMVQVSKDGIVRVMRAFVKLEPNVHCRFVKGSGEDKDFILMYLSKEIPRTGAQDPSNRRLRAAFFQDDQPAEAEALI